MLTHRQEKFARLLFQGATQREAWRLAGYSTNYSNDDIDHNSCVAANSIKIKSRVNELRDKAAMPDILTVTARKKRLSTVANHPVEMPVSASHVTSAIQELNRMEGVYSEVLLNDNRVFNLIVSDKASKLLPGVAKRRKMIEGEFEEIKEE